jgi:peptidoglycan/LPS O-acetylase OafA/YrhL
VTEENAHRYDFIDSIRGIAALCVVFEHVLGILAKHMGPEQVAFADAIVNRFGFGKFGVVLFFIVSGFVVPFSLRGPRWQGLRHFAISRFFRLYPAYWVSILAALILIPWALDPPASVGSVLVNLTMLQQFVGVPNLMLLYWTLQIELIFYVFCAFVFVCGQLDKPRMIFRYALIFLASALGLAAARYHFALKLPVAVPLGLVMMCFGLLYRRGFLEQEADAKRYAYWLLGLFGALMPVIALLAYNQDMGFGERWTVYTVSYLSAVVAFIFLTTFMRLRQPFFVWLGRISYSVYLFHPIVIFLYRRTMGEALYALPILLHFVIVSGLTLGLCHLLFIYIEAPSVLLGKRLTRSVKIRWPMSERIPVN